MAEGQQRVPEAGRCICAHVKSAHVKHDEHMERVFPGQIWDGCSLCDCPMFRQEDDISIGMQCDALRFTPATASGEPPARPPGASEEDKARARTVTAEERTREFCEHHSNPNWTRHHGAALTALLREAETAAFNEGVEAAADLCDSRAFGCDNGGEALEIAALQLKGAAEGIRALRRPPLPEQPQSQEQLAKKGDG